MSEVAVQADLEIRDLSEHELRAIVSQPPFDSMGLEGAGLKHVRVVGAFRDSRMVACWMLHDAVHAEPVWIAEEERANPAVIRPLWESVRRVLVGSGCPVAYVVVGDGALANSAPLAMRLGFQPMNGNLFYLLVDEARNLRRREE